MTFATLQTIHRLLVEEEVYQKKEKDFSRKRLQGLEDLDLDSDGSLDLGHRIDELKAAYDEARDKHNEVWEALQDFENHDWR